MLEFFLKNSLDINAKLNCDCVALETFKFPSLKFLKGYDFEEKSRAVVILRIDTFLKDKAYFRVVIFVCTPLPF